MISDRALVEWKEMAQRDDWHLSFVGSDIRQMIGEIERLRDQIAAERQAHEATIKHANEIIDWHQ